MIKAEMIADSIGPSGVRISTMLLEYPRIIHGEFMTHRVFSRNASSSRAIPFSKMISEIKKNMFIPHQFQKRHKGMQGTSFFSGWRESICKSLWQVAGYSAIYSAQQLDKIGVTKQLANRITEPFSHIKVVVTSTEWTNFFGLRDHEDAEIHIRDLAKEMKKVYDESMPTPLKYGEWHLPFIREEDKLNVSDEKELLKMSVARCARTSYLNNYGKNDPEADFKLYDQLIVSDPKHASPCEHQAMALSKGDSTLGIKDWHDGISHCDNNAWLWSGNFKGWIQYRKTIKGENIQ